jgi:hypothetical protein
MLILQNTVVAKTAIHFGVQPFQRGNPENPYYIPCGHHFFIVSKGGNTQILILSYLCQSICCALHTAT